MRFVRTACALAVLTYLFAGCDSGGIQPGPVSNASPDNGLGGMPTTKSNLSEIKNSAKASGGMVNPPK